MYVAWTLRRIITTILGFRKLSLERARWATEFCIIVFRLMSDNRSSVPLRVVAVIPSRCLSVQSIEVLFIVLWCSLSRECAVRLNDICCFLPPHDGVLGNWLLIFICWWTLAFHALMFIAFWTVATILRLWADAFCAIFLVA